MLHHLIFTLSYAMVVQASNIAWPSGSYGLAKPTNGCPEFWKEGLRYQDTEDIHSNNIHSVSYHLSGTVNEHGVRQEFCIKDENLFDEEDINWPDGKYCIYKYGSKCPKGLTEGWVFWDDENVEDLDGGNTVTGYVPEGVYELDTLMYFCCNNKGNKSKTIDLPLTNSFYLLAFGSKECQAVRGTSVTSEYIKWDDEDRGNTNSHSSVVPYGVRLDPFNTQIFYCYYDTGICGQFGTVCQNSSIDETGFDGKSVLTDDVKTGGQDSIFSHNIMKKRKTSLHAVAIGCGVAAAIISSAVAALSMRHYFNRKIDQNRKIDKYLSEEEIFPLPDHIW